MTSTLNDYRACPKEYESATHYFDPSGKPYKHICAGCGIELDKHQLLSPDEIADREAARWQERITPILQEVCDVDGAGCDSGDPLDVTDLEVRQAINHLNDRIAAIAQERDQLLAKFDAIKHQLPPCPDQPTAEQSA